MKTQKLFLITFIVLLFSCKSYAEKSTETAVQAFVLPTGPASTNLLMPTAYPTLPAEIQNKLFELLRTNGNCELPCFLGIYPGKTTLGQALSYFQIYTRDHRLLAYDVSVVSPYQWHYSPNFDTKQGDLHVFFHLYIQSSNEMLNGFIVNFQSVINPDQTSNVKNNLLDRYGILELFRRHGVPDLIYLNPPRVHQTQNAYNIEIVYSDEKIMAIYPGAAKLADNDKYILCPAIGDGDVSSFSIALANPADQKLNIIEFARGSFNKNFSLSFYDDKIKLDPQGIYDLFDKQEKRCFYEDEFRVEQ